MANTIKTLNTTSGESPIKHTAGAELPDSSAKSSFARRIAADTSLLGDPAIRKYWLLPVALIGAGFGIFPAVRSNPARWRQFLLATLRQSLLAAARNFGKQGKPQVLPQGTDRPSSS